MKNELSYSIENELRAEGYRVICGVDEAGRGPLCGPVCAGACILRESEVIEGLNDSKKLSAARREALFDEITEKAVAWSVALGTVEEINETNILEATLLAMRRAIAGLKVKPDFALIDGNICRGFDLPAKSVIHGDALSPSIAAASILAKVTRDRICDDLDEEYPQYGIAKHKGYGTKEHMDALRRYGPAPIYRTKFIRFLDNDNKNDR